MTMLYKKDNLNALCSPTSTLKDKNTDTEPPGRGTEDTGYILEGQRHTDMYSRETSLVSHRHTFAHYNQKMVTN